MLTEQDKIALAGELTRCNMVSFIVDGWDTEGGKLLIVIFASDNGWDITTYDVYNDMTKEDGGVCTGSAYAAINFMIPGEEGMN